MAVVNGAGLASQSSSDCTSLTADALLKAFAAVSRSVGVEVGVDRHRFEGTKS